MTCSHVCTGNVSFCHTVGVKKQGKKDAVSRRGRGVKVIKSIF
jgi:hypothetical protein